jgi:sulfopyruvate decarboxylase TPP-binding subunit
MNVPATGVDEPSAARLNGAAIVEAIKQSGVEFVVALPDIVTCETVLRPISTDPNLKLVTVCKEDEGLSICAGLSYCDKRALLLMQHTGLLDSINAVRVIAAEYELPICMMVGLQGMETDRAPKSSEKFGIRIVEPILQSMGIAYHVLENANDIASIAPTIEEAYQNSQPVVLIVARSPA